MKTLSFKLSIAITFIIFSSTLVSAVYVTNPSTNSSVTRGKCKYTLSNGYYVSAWKLDYNACVQTLPNGTVDPEGFKHFYDALYVKWKNIEANATTQLVYATWYWGILNNQTDPIEVGPFTLYMPVPSFSSGTSFNIPCYINSPVTISLNPYINTEANGIDQGETITSNFEWNLPSGWQTSSGKTGTFVGSSSIDVIPPASTTSTSISVRAKANTQYSPVTTLQISRNLDDFDVKGESDVVYNSSYRYEVPFANGVSYSWDLPVGWSGSSNTNYIDATVGCGTGNITATMIGCTGTKSATKIISLNVTNLNTEIEGSDYVCKQNSSYSILNLPEGTTINWIPSPNVKLISNQGTNPAIFGMNGIGSGTIQAQITACNITTNLPMKEVWVGIQKPDIVDIEMDAPYHRFTAKLRNEVPTATSYNWYLDGVLNTIEHGSTVIFNRKNPYCGGEYHVEVEALNDYCGPSAKTYKLVFEPDCLYRLLVSPNPSVAESTVELLDETGITVTSEMDWDLEVYDQNQMLKEKKTKIKGKYTNLKTSKWKDGIYYLRAHYNDEWISEKLVVKHD